MDAFENLDVWQQSFRLATDIYKLLTSCKDNTFKNELNRIAMSLPASIAQAYEDPQNRQTHLHAAKACCGELKTYLYIGKNVGTIPADCVEDLVIDADKISPAVSITSP